MFLVLTARLARKERQDPSALLVREGFPARQALMGCQDPWVPQAPRLLITASL